MREHIAVVATIALSLVSASPTLAQYTSDYQTNIISGVTSNWTGDYDIGNTNSADVFLIRGSSAHHRKRNHWDAFRDYDHAGHASVLFDTNGNLGSSVGSSNNSVLVSGVGAVWSNSGTLAVGDFGSGNRLVIRHGGQAVSIASFLGANPGSSNNGVLVADKGSVWNSGYMEVGRYGGGNSLVISHGGQVIGGGSDIGTSFLSSNNTVLVTGTGSFWGGGWVMTIGSRGNRLVISDGGQVVDGYYGSVRSSSSSFLVTGAGSVWSNGYTLEFRGADNRLVISNGGQVISGRGFLSSPDGNSNSVLVTGPGSVWSNSSDLGVGEGGGAESDRLVISDSGRVVTSNCFVDAYSSVLVTGLRSVLSDSGSLSVGYYSPYNSLVITNGGRVMDENGFLGVNGSSALNSVHVVDGGVWQNSILQVGRASGGNAVIVDGGAVFATNLVIGPFTTDCDNLVQLDSGRIVVTNADATAVLEVLRGLFVLNGGTLRVDTLVITNGCARFYHNGGTLIVGKVVLDPNLSATGDGIPNGWKQAHGLDPLSTNGINNANADPDGDGFTNLQKYLAGTDPTSSASAFRITSIVLTNNSDLLVTWMTGLSKTNALQVMTNFPSGYSDIFTVTNTSGTVTNYLDAGAVTNSPTRYYRVRLVP